MARTCQKSPFTQDVSGVGHWTGLKCGAAEAMERMERASNRLKLGLADKSRREASYENNTDAIYFVDFFVPVYNVIMNSFRLYQIKVLGKPLLVTVAYSVLWKAFIFALAGSDEERRALLESPIGAVLIAEDTRSIQVRSQSRLN